MPARHETILKHRWWASDMMHGSLREHRREERQRLVLFDRTNNAPRMNQAVCGSNAPATVA
jgi:hypothetical protein